MNKSMFFVCLIFSCSCCTFQPKKEEIKMKIKLEPDNHVTVSWNTIKAGDYILYRRCNADGPWEGIKTFKVTRRGEINCTLPIIYSQEFFKVALFSN